MKFLLQCLVVSLLTAAALLDLPEGNHLHGLTPTPVPTGGKAGWNGDPIDLFYVYGASRKIVPVEDQPFSRAFRITTTAEKQNFWEVECGRVLSLPVTAGDVALVRFYARSLQGKGESNESTITVYSQLKVSPWSKSTTEDFTIGSTWQEYFLAYTFLENRPAEQEALVFGFGHGAQTVEIGGIEFWYYGRQYKVEDLPRTFRTYRGREEGAAWRNEAWKRIEQIRKGDMQIEVVDGLGQPVAGAVVEVDLRRHSFPFGSVAVAHRIMGKTAEDETYRTMLRRLFSSTGTENDLKWPPWEGEWGAMFQREQTVQALQWMKDHFVYVRGHVLVWPGWSNLPARIRQMYEQKRFDEIQPATLAHIDDITQATKGLVDGWDVLNEPYANHDLQDLLGQQIEREWFARARQNLPNAQLFLNDYGILSSGGTWQEKQDAFIATAKYLQEGNCGITGIGVQCHFGANVTPPERVLEILDRLQRELSLDIHVTEFDVNSSDTAMQADFTRDFYIAAFSHPAVKLIQMWGFWAKAHWLPKAALYDENWQERPNGKAYRQLMENEFHTHLTGIVDDQGRWSGRGFFGEYAVTVKKDGRQVTQSFTLSTKGESWRVVWGPNAMPRVTLRQTGKNNLVWVDYWKEMDANRRLFRSENLDTWQPVSELADRVDTYGTLVQNRLAIPLLTPAIFFQLH